MVKWSNKVLGDRSFSRNRASVSCSKTQKVIRKKIHLFYVSTKRAALRELRFSSNRKLDTHHMK